MRFSCVIVCVADLLVNKGPKQMRTATIVDSLNAVWEDDQVPLLRSSIVKLTDRAGDIASLILLWGLGIGMPARRGEVTCGWVGTRCKIANQEKIHESYIRLAVWDEDNQDLHPTAASTTVATVACSTTTTFFS